MINILPLNSACDDDLVETGDDYAREVPALNDMAECDMRAAVKALADNGDDRVYPPTMRARPLPRWVVWATAPWALWAYPAVYVPA